MTLEPTNQVLLEVLSERQRQDDRWGEQNHPNGTDKSYGSLALAAKTECEAAHRIGVLTYADILKEEFWEAMSEEDPERLREELIQVAAVAVAWVEKLDREASNDVA